MVKTIYSFHCLIHLLFLKYIFKYKTILYDENLEFSITYDFSLSTYEFWLRYPFAPTNIHGIHFLSGRLANVCNIYEKQLSTFQNFDKFISI